MTLRPYQIEALSNRLKNSHKNYCIQAPTGTGKSKIIEAELNYNLNLNKKTLVLVPKQELTTNIERYNPDTITKAFSGYVPNLEKPILCCTYQSAMKYLDKFQPDHIISDECHHIKKGGLWARVLKKANVPHTGYTATPNRLDGQGLYHWFRDLHTSPQIKWFIENQYLSPFKLFTSKAPSFNESTDALDVQESIFIPEVKHTVERWCDVAYGTKTIVFATTIKHCELLCKAFQAIGVSAATLSHETPLRERNRVFSAFKRGDITVLVNVALFTEGVDVPDCETVVLSRFTYSTALFLQMVGRVFRYLLGKVSLVLDLANNSYYHGAPDTPFFWSLEGEDNTGIKGNHSTLYHYCDKCDMPLAHKKYIKDVSNICCLNCHHVNVNIQPLSEKKGNARLHRTFNVDELHHLEDTQITAITRVLNKSKGTFQDKMNQILLLDIPNEIKKKALSSKGISVKDIDFFFDEDD